MARDIFLTFFQVHYMGGTFFGHFSAETFPGQLLWDIFLTFFRGHQNLQTFFDIFKTFF